jgi:hypothetical protein
MNLNEKFATSINQGKELIDIGIDPSTADLCWTNESYKGPFYVEQFEIFPKSYDYVRKLYDDYKERFANTGGVLAWDVIPAWSLSKLMKLMPTLVEKYGRLNIVRNGEEVTEFRYGSDIIFGSPDAIDAAVDMIKWLIRNGYIRQ